MRAPFAGPSYMMALIWSRSDLRICRNIYWHDTKQRNPIHHIFSAGYVKSANTFTNLSRIPCLYDWIWLEPRIGVWLNPRLKYAEWQYKAFTALSIGSRAVYLMWDEANFSSWWYGELLYCIKGPIPLTHGKYIVFIRPTRARTHRAISRHWKSAIPVGTRGLKLANDDHSSYKANEPKANFGWNWQDQSDLGQDKKVFGLMIQLFVLWNNVRIVSLTLFR